MGRFGAVHGWGPKSSPVPKICHTYPNAMKLGTVIPNLKTIRKMCKRRDTIFDFC